MRQSVCRKGFGRRGPAEPGAPHRSGLCGALAAGLSRAERLDDLDAHPSSRATYRSMRRVLRRLYSPCADRLQHHRQSRRQGYTLSFIAFKPGSARRPKRWSPVASGEFAPVAGILPLFPIGIQCSDRRQATGSCKMTVLKTTDGPRRRIAASGFTPLTGLSAEGVAALER